jgi:uncharacterized membrane protein
MSFANPAALALLALAIPVLLAHVLRPRRTPVTVSSVLLWRRLERPVSAAQPWQRLRWSLLLLAQLLAVALLAVVVAGPQRLEAARLAEHTVFILDASASMAATDGDPDRLADAKDRISELRDEIPVGGRASVIVAGDSPRVLLTASPDRAEVERVLRTVDQSAGHPDFAGAFALAESLDDGATPIGFVFVSDGGLTDAEVRLLPPATRYERVGSGVDNRGIARLTVEPRGAGLHVRVAVANHGPSEVTQSLRIDVDGVTAGSQPVTIGAGEQVDVEVDVPRGDRVEAFLEGDDLLAVDDRAAAVTTARPDLRVLLAGDPLFWRELLTSMPGVTVDVVEEPVSAAGYDLAVYSAVDVPADPGAPFVAVAPPGGLAPAVTVTGAVERPAVTLVRNDDPMLAGIDLSGVAVASAQRVEPAGATVLVAGEGAPLLVRGTHGDERFAYFTFDLRNSNLPVQVAFPLLGDRLVAELTGTGQVRDAIAVGDRLPVPAGGGRVAGPDAEVQDVAPGEPAPRADRPGFWTITAPDTPDVLVAVNPPRDESDIAPADHLDVRLGGDRGPVVEQQQANSLRTWFLWPLLAVVALEAFLAWRKLGVGQRQWRIALGVRAAVAALIVAALLTPVISRSEDRVATVFVVDVSASIGSGGSDDARQFVRDALAARDESARAGVVVFGADAQVDQIVSDAASFGTTTAVVDATATDVAAALRLGAAILPADARRRVVLISDGRPTTGDTDREIEALRTAGVPVDVHLVGTATELDAAVASVDVPRLARVDEAVPVTVEIDATAAADAVVVVLRRDGVEVDRQQVALLPGENTVRFSDRAGVEAGAVLRYDVVVTVAGDSLPENDVGFAAVPVDGPARVLVVEGAEGEATTLVSALEAGNVGTEVVSPAEIPDLQELATFAGVVLVDVDARELTGADIDALTRAVRDLGRGLVTVGGARSYGVGGYRDSPLSDLLPVDSEVMDPKRRKTVAEVLSIDTSESMSACHCAGPNMDAARETGGPNKTDISRAAAERTIAALAETDEVGVLAWNSSAEWVIELQQLPAADVVDRGLRSLRPFGATNMRQSLDEAAEALIASNAELKHIILFSDGFTAPEVIAATADEAAELYEEHGITVSVLATGEGAAPLLGDIAVAGHGRFYAGTDLEQIPQIMAQEAVIASRNFITEGEFFPEVTSSDEVVADLTESPALLGYVATTAKPQASTLLRIGPDRDPLLARWQAGLGRVTSWTSDVTNWSARWATWDGFVEFWSRIVKDTLPSGDFAGAVQATVRDGRVTVDVEGRGAFPDGARAVATVAGPDGQLEQIPMERDRSDRFVAESEAARAGSYAVSATVTDAAGEVVLSSSTLASANYPAEFSPGEPDAATLARISDGTGGRGEVAAADVWSPDGLTAGRRLIDLTVPLLLAAALLWPLAVLLSRLTLRRDALADVRTGAVAGAARARRRLRTALPRLGQDPDNVPVRPAPPPPPPPAPEVPAAPPRASPSPPPPPPPPPAPAAAGRPSTVDDLVARKRARQTRD